MAIILRCDHHCDFSAPNYVFHCLEIGISAANAGIMLNQCLRWWSNIVRAFGERMIISNCIYLLQVFLMGDQQITCSCSHFAGWLLLYPLITLCPYLIRGPPFNFSGGRGGGDKNYWFNIIYFNLFKFYYTFIKNSSWSKLFVSCSQPEIIYFKNTSACSP